MKIYTHDIGIEFSHEIYPILITLVCDVFNVEYIIADFNAGFYSESKDDFLIRSNF